jgi:hypothetical protein
MINKNTKNVNKNKLKNNKYNNYVLNGLLSLLLIAIIINYNNFIKCMNNFINNELNNSYILMYGIIGIYILISLFVFKYKI